MSFRSAICALILFFLCCQQVSADAAKPDVANTAAIIEYDSELAEPQPGPHQGGGTSTAYPFFKDAEGFEMAFRKRALHKDAAIGGHFQERDEVYYILSGTGEFSLNGVTQPVTAGTAILTRAGNTHGLRQTGEADLVLIIAYSLDDDP
jgi:mannose-6-phosphate isomerase-like protein (cupin superfamily)